MKYQSLLAVCVLSSTVLAGCPVLHLVDSGASMDALLESSLAETSTDAPVSESAPDASMDAHVDAAPDVPRSVCALTVAGNVVVGTPVDGMLQPTGGTLTSNNCALGGMWTAAEQVYRLVLAAPATLQITAGPQGEAGTLDFSTALTVAVRTDCSTQSTELGCAFRNFATDVPLRGRFEAGTYYVIVDGRVGSASPLPYTLSVQALPAAAPNAVCAQAMTVAPGSSVMGQSSATGLSAGPRCGSFSDRTLYYQVTIPAGQRAVIAASPVAMTGTEALRLQVADSCAFDTCFDQVSAGSGMAARSYVDNPGTAPRTVYVAVSPQSADPVTFTLSATLTPIPFTVTTIATACDALDSATLLGASGGGAGSWTDDSTSAPVFIPFAFAMLGDSAQYLTVASNGFVQLQSSSAGAGRTDTGASARLPNANTPPGVIAPFWLDMFPVIEMVGATMVNTGEVRYATLGAAPSRRFVVGWNHFSLFADRGARVQFQVKLFEGSHNIEFHYCALSRVAVADAGTLPDPNVLLGSTATIGVQNFAGNDGYTFAFQENRAVVSTTQALRLTPTP